MDNARSLVLIRRLDRSLTKGGEKLPPERVHLIRTSARRLEALLARLRDSGQRQGKLRKRLKRLRRGAGAVRDIDVQIAALRKLKIGRELERKSRLMQALNDRRAEVESCLARSLRDKDTQKLRRGLRRWSSEMNSAAPQPANEVDEELAAALRMFAQLTRKMRSLTADNLHDYRTRCKQIRYLAEIAGPRAEAVVTELKRIQDAVGDWHDWLTLTETAEALFTHRLEGGLVAALRNVTNAKFVEARGVCLDVRRVLGKRYPALQAESRLLPAAEGRKAVRRAAAPATHEKLA